MFKSMLKKVQGKKGFTLMEMLIVVAIIAILVAVAFPIFNAQLDKAATAADAANERSAKAVATVVYMNAPGTAFTQKFDAAKGILVPSADAVTGYGQSKTNKGKVISVAVTTTGDITVSWVAGS